ncbi:unnamed protein product [Ectocarpus sp. 12 AP-2014]
MVAPCRYVTNMCLLHSRVLRMVVSFLCVVGVVVWFLCLLCVCFLHRSSGSSAESVSFEKKTAGHRKQRIDQIRSKSRKNHHCSANFRVLIGIGGFALFWINKAETDL